MKIFKVVFEIEVDANTPLGATKEVQRWLQVSRSNWQFYVQEEETGEIVSVDLEEENADAVLPVKEYIPMIKPTKETPPEQQQPTNQTAEPDRFWHDGE